MRGVIAFLFVASLSAGLFVCLFASPPLSISRLILFAPFNEVIFHYFRKFSFMIDDGSLYCPIMKQFIILSMRSCVSENVYEKSASWKLNGNVEDPPGQLNNLKYSKYTT